MLRQSLLWLGIVLLGAPLLQGEPAGEIALPDGRVLYYSVFNSAQVDPAASAQHGLVRGANRGMLNITVRDSQGEVHAVVSGFAKNLIGQNIPLEFLEVTEPGAVYYIAGFVFGHEDLLNFSIDVKPQGGEPYPLRFQQKMYLQQ